MELATGHAPQMTLEKSPCWMHVSAAEQANEPPICGSTPAQQRVGIGMVVVVAAADAARATAVLAEAGERVHAIGHVRARGADEAGCIVTGAAEAWVRA
jgi:hypothetical protein